MRFLALFLVLSIAGCLTPNPRAAIRSEAGYRLGSCLNIAPDFPSRRQTCLQESNDYCHSQGLETNCGIDDMWPAHRKSL
jgi:hypothetical protein